MIHAVAAAYHNIKIHANWRNQPKQCQRLLKDDKIFACGGSWMVKNLVDAGDFDKIQNVTKKLLISLKRDRGVRLWLRSLL